MTSTEPKKIEIAVKHRPGYFANQAEQLLIPQHWQAEAVLPNGEKAKFVSFKSSEQAAMFLREQILDRMERQMPECDYVLY